jgi:hypothetical protein
MSGAKVVTEGELERLMKDAGLSPSEISLQMNIQRSVDTRVEVVLKGRSYVLKREERRRAVKKTR